MGESPDPANTPCWRRCPGTATLSLPRGAWVGWPPMKQETSSLTRGLRSQGRGYLWLLQVEVAVGLGVTVGLGLLKSCKLLLLGTLLSTVSGS